MLRHDAICAEKLGLLHPCFAKHNQIAMTRLYAATDSKSLEPSRFCYGSAFIFIKGKYSNIIALMHVLNFFVPHLLYA